MKPSTKPRVDLMNEDLLADDIQVTGTDTGIGGSSVPLGDLSWDQLLAQLRAGATGNVPPGCEGGDPSTWPTVPVGDKQGRLQQLCNAALVYVLSGRDRLRVRLGPLTFDAGRHLDEIDFLQVLKRVSFPGEAAPPAPPSTH